MSIKGKARKAVTDLDNAESVVRNGDWKYDKIKPNYIADLQDVLWGIIRERDAMMFRMVICRESGDGFMEGKIYPQMGYNNGIHVVRETDGGDIHEIVCCSGGIGKGDLNNFDNSGKPSFDWWC